jgi:hypothetical protein
MNQERISMHTLQSHIGHLLPDFEASLRSNSSGRIILASNQVKANH